MTNFRTFILFCFLTTFTTSAFAFGSTLSYSDFQIDPIVKEEAPSITITINSSFIIKMKDVPKTGHLEVMSILGKRVTIKNLKDCADGVYIDLPNGIYVIKAGRVSQKIVVRN